MATVSIEVVLGQVQIQMEHLVEQMRRSNDESSVFRDEMRSAVKDLDERMREVEAVILTARSSWRTIVWLGSTVGLLTAAFWTLFTTFHDTTMRVIKIFTTGQ